MCAVGNPCHNAQAESFMKTLKVEKVYLSEYETFADVVHRSSTRGHLRSEACFRLQEELPHPDVRSHIDRDQPEPR